MKLLVALLVPILLLAGACASAPRHQATVASGTVYAALAAVQDTEATLHTGGQITDAQHKAFAAKMVVALESGRAFNAAVSAWPHGTEVPVTLKAKVDAVFTSANAAAAVLPLGPARDAVFAKVLVVAKAIADVLVIH